MRAQVLYGIKNLKLSEVEDPTIGEDEALVRVRRCGICGSDVPRIYKTGAHNMPLIPGHEMSGVVAACSCRPELVGKRVGIFPLIPCRECEQCRNQHYEMCKNYDYLGSRSDGGFAELVKVPVWNLLPVPDEVSDDDAAMLEPMCVAVHALRLTGLIGNHMDVKEGMTLEPAVSDKSITVCGLGTIGLLVALFLRDAGYRNVFCIGNKDIQWKKLMTMGYSDEQFIDVRREAPVDKINEKTGGCGTDYYFECIGRSESFEQAVKCTAALGQIMLVGNPASDMSLAREVYWKILRNQLTLRGTWNSSFNGIDGEGDDWRYALDRLSAWTAMKAEGSDVMLPGDLITHRFSLENMQDGLDVMHRKSDEYVKIMVESN